MSIALFAGSFDPFTEGHYDIVRRATLVCDKLIIGVAHNAEKKTLFSIDERMALIEETLTHQDFPIEVVAISGLTIQAAKEYDATLLIRGLRRGSEADYELQMAALNEWQDEAIKTILIPGAINLAPISSTFVKDIARYGGDLTGLVPRHVVKALQEKYQGGN
jgi:pantetheine-phosphate adenylyltransferase